MVTSGNNSQNKFIGIKKVLELKDFELLSILYFFIEK